MRIQLATLILTLAAQAAHAKVEIRDVQAAHGLLGPARSSTEYLPGDEVFYRFTIAGARAGDDGRMSGEIRMKLTDANGKTLLEKAAPVRQQLAFGGDRFPAKAAIQLGHQFPPGDYRLAIEYTDYLSGEGDAVEQAFSVKPTEFGIVRVRFAADEEGKAPTRLDGAPGQPLHMRLAAVGFDRAGGSIDVEMEVRVLDARGRPVAPAGVRAAVRSADPDAVKSATHATFTAELTRTRPGDFIVRVTVTDKQSGRAVTFDAPMRVTD